MVNILTIQVLCLTALIVTITAEDECADLKEERECLYWKAAGDCTDHTVERYCKKTCELCSQAETEPAAETEYEATAECADLKGERECLYWKAAGDCTNHTVERYCKKTCDLCSQAETEPAAETAAEATAECADLKEERECLYWKAAGYCTDHTVDLYCKKTCELCPQDETEPAAETEQVQTTGFTRDGDICYKLFKEKKKFPDAMKACWELDALLPEPSTKAKNDAIQLLAVEHNVHNIWLGGNDIAMEGKWIWNKNQTPFTYTDWGSGEPDNGKINEFFWTNENCLVTTSSWWFDAPCWSHRAYMCVKPSGKHYGDKCTDTCQCKAGFECTEGQCACPTRHIYNNGRCLDVKMAHGARCTTTSQCAAGFECWIPDLKYGKCDCPALQYYEDGQCYDLKDYGDSCTATRQCRELMICSEGKCGCDEEIHYYQDGECIDYWG